MCSPPPPPQRREESTARNSTFLLCYLLRYGEGGGGGGTLALFHINARQADSNTYAEECQTVCSHESPAFLEPPSFSTHGTKAVQMQDQCHTTKKPISHSFW